MLESRLPEEGAVRDRQPMKQRACVFALLFATVPHVVFAAASAAQPASPNVLGIPIEFILFALMLQLGYGLSPFVSGLAILASASDLNCPLG